jgi:hypothetical protein
VLSIETSSTPAASSSAATASISGTVAPASQTLETRLPAASSGGRRRQIILVALAMPVPATFSWRSW